MKTSLIILLLISLITLSLSKKPQITVYIESLCPDCVAYITQSFKQFNNNPSKHDLADVILLPFGNGHANKVNNTYTFVCQHGENECYGNKIETCALALLEEDVANTLLVCIEENIVSFKKDFDQTLAKCMCGEKEPKEILDCAKGNLGNELLYKVAKKTGEHNYVPFVLVDGVHDRETENRILDNMVDYLCDLIERADELPGCDQSKKHKSLAFLSNDTKYSRCYNGFLFSESQ